MGTHRRGLTLAERRGVTSREARSARHRHCWIIDEHGARHPGLLLEWRQGPAGWHGLVAYVTGAGDAYTLMQRWIAADKLRSAAPETPVETGGSQQTPS
jgi:hypothetical protein